MTEGGAGPYRTTALTPPQEPSSTWFRSACWWAFGVIFVDSLFTRWIVLSFALLLVAPLWIVLRGLGLCVRREWKGLHRYASQCAFLLVTLGFALGLAAGDLWAVRHGEDTIVGAAERYRAREGRYPESLAALVPGDLAAIPSAGLPYSLALPFSYSAHNGDATLGHAMRFTTARRYYTFKARRRWGND